MIGITSAHGTSPFRVTKTVMYEIEGSSVSFTVPSCIEESKVARLDVTVIR